MSFEKCTKYFIILFILFLISPVQALDFSKLPANFVEQCKQYSILTIPDNYLPISYIDNGNKDRIFCLLDKFGLIFIEKNLERIGTAVPKSGIAS